MAGGGPGSPSFFLNGPEAFGERDKARMHDLAVRNQEDALTPAEKEEMFAYAKAGTLLGILQSRARRVLGIKPTKRTAS
jgi:hypothetical protein